MTSIRLLGTVTSPFVRRVRVVCLEKGIPFSLVDTSTAEGQQALRAASPVWKVPTAVLADGRAVWDSRLIIEELFAQHGGWAPLRGPPTDSRQRLEEEELMVVVDEALLSLIRLFYLQKDGLDVTQAPYLVKERERAHNLLAWLDGRVRGACCTPVDGFGRAELALFSALAWMRFRAMADVDAYPKLAAFERAWAERPSLVATRPG